MEKLIVSSSPHFNGGRTTQNIMLDVIIALVPAMVASVILFGFRASSPVWPPASSANTCAAG